MKGGEIHNNEELEAVNKITDHSKSVNVLNSNSINVKTLTISHFSQKYYK